ncbi:lipoprotein-anchoring transpeptidase ErfK/SrfK [Crossiella equi]|uniref:Lipoprotein-anchoring transpeptidase ErfK/SrfK n=1 Tax=Crossiella equi TaxID=130796 RepID=A0ABS5AIM7_9PSEU|nr:L,D-transpeptidase [Crossiella equi]MBP2476401.1 lipoprotein-anchoring transpeptidase ErfK/SrfK [Crossiella equi]
MRGKKSLVLAVTATVGLLLAACGTEQVPQLAGNTAPASNSGSATPSPSSSTSDPTTVPPAPSSSSTRPTTTTPPKPKPKQPEQKDTVQPAGVASGTPCKATARACIDLSANKAWLMDNGKAVYGPVPITHGRKGWLTPPGTFSVTRKNKNHRSSIFNNAPMPWSVFFNGGIAFHQGSLREKSHGCIHLSPAAAQKFFSFLQLGDQVHVVR